MRNERTHAARLGKGQCMPIVGFGGARIEPFRVARYVAEEMLGMGFQPW
jgi:hypothetical protein